MGSGVLQIHGFCLFLTVWAWAKHITSSSSPGKCCYYLVPWITVKMKLNNAHKTLGTVSRVLKTNKQANKTTKSCRLYCYSYNIVLCYKPAFVYAPWVRHIVRICLTKASPLQDKFGAQCLFFFLLVRSESLGQCVTWAGAIWNPQWSDSLMVTWDPNGLN